MDILFALVGIAIGIVVAALYFRSRPRGMPPPDAQHERELKALLDEVRELRLEIDILKVNPTIGDAVKATLQHAHDQADFERSAYDVLVRPSKVPASVYNVAAVPRRSPGEDRS